MNLPGEIDPEISKSQNIFRVGPRSLRYLLVEMMKTGEIQSYRLRGPVPQKIAILRALHLGDMMCTIPALRALKTALPGSDITLIGLPWASDFTKRFPLYLDDFIEFPGYPGLPEQEPDIFRIPAFISEMQDQRFDLVLQMQGSGSITNSLVALFGGKTRRDITCPVLTAPTPTPFSPIQFTNLKSSVTWD